MSEISSITTIHDQLVEVGRSMTLSRLADSLAHDMRQPITAIQFNAHTIQSGILHDDLETELLTEVMHDIVADVGRTEHLLQSWSTLLRFEITASKPLELQDEINLVQTLLAGELLTQKVTLEIKCAASLPPVSCSRRDFLHAILAVILQLMDSPNTKHRSQRLLTLETCLTEDKRPIIHLRAPIDSTYWKQATANLEQDLTAFHPGEPSFHLRSAAHIIQKNGGELILTTNEGQGTGQHPANSHC